MTNRILVGAVFLVGCAVGGVSSQLVVPKASAQQAAALTKWEHACVELQPGNLDSTAKKFGVEGFEIAGLGNRSGDVSLWACFKRPKL